MDTSSTGISAVDRPNRRSPPDPKPFESSDLPAVVRWNFRGQCPSLLLEWGSRRQESVIPMDLGLKVVRGPMADASEFGIAFEVAADVFDDFEITLEFRDFKSIPTCADWRVPRVDISGQIFSATEPEKRIHVLGINHRRDIDGTLKVLAVQGDNAAASDLRYRSKTMPVERDSGRLRLVRQGGMMFYQASPLEAEHWSTIDCHPVDRGPFKSIVVGLRADDLDGSGEAILTGVAIRARGIHPR